MYQFKHKIKQEILEFGSLIIINCMNCRFDNHCYIYIILLHHFGWECYKLRTNQSILFSSFLTSTLIIDCSTNIDNRNSIVCSLLVVHILFGSPEL